MAAVKERTEETFVPESWISANFLKKCFERKGGEPAGFISSFQKEGRFGKKQVCPGNFQIVGCNVSFLIQNYRGPPGWWFPKRFLQIKLNTGIIGDR